MAATQIDAIAELAKYDTTAKKIKWAVAYYKSQNNAKPLWAAYKLLQAAKITTKNGTEIRYQHIRNTMLQMVK